MKPEKSSSHQPRLSRLRRLARILDDAIPIPGTKYRIGIDPILGMIPGGGDTVTGALGAYIIVEAARMGLPRKVIGKMIGNIVFDSLAGIIPVLGDLLDVGWKANVRNMALLEKHLQLNPQGNKSDIIFIIGLVVLLTVIVLGFASLTFFLISWLVGLVNR